MSSTSTTPVFTPARPSITREIVMLALPLALVQMGASALGVIDTAVVGRTTPAQLAAVGLGNSLFFSFSILGMGLVLGTEPLIAQAVGAQDFALARRRFRQGMWTALLCTPLILAGIAAVIVLLPRFGLDPEVVPYAQRYMIARAPGLLPFLLYWAAKAWLQAHNRTRAPVVGVVLSIIVELFLDVILVFGSDALGIPWLGVPALGVIGAGLSHSFTNTVRFVVVLVAAELIMRNEGLSGEPPPTSLAERWARARDALRINELLVVARIGFPLGLTMALEVAVFAFAALTMGRLGKNELAAHQVAIQCASTTFNAMVGLGSATSVVVGRRIGAGDRDGALRAGLTGMALSSLVMLATGALFFFAGATLARVLTDKPDVVVGAAALLAVAAAFQLSDGIQTVASGALRGAGDTRATFAIHLVAHWAIGMPCVLWFVGRGLGAPGVWWGLTLGLTFAAIALAARFVVKAKRGYAKL